MQLAEINSLKFPKSYALAEICVDGQRRYLVGSEKDYGCILLDEGGNAVEWVLKQTGGIMSIEPLPEKENSFLATEKFYSPNNSAEARIILVERHKNGWHRRTICELPFVHRFGILVRDGTQYLVAATLKSAHAFPNDWTCPGRVWVAELPKNLSEVDENAPLQMQPLISGLSYNHGFFKYSNGDTDEALFCAKNGIFRVTPPIKGSDWKWERIFDQPVSDALLVDFDGDDQKELLTFSPFHGNCLTVYKSRDGSWETVYCNASLPFLHALYSCTWKGKEIAIIGYRKGLQEIAMLQYNDGAYAFEPLVKGAGAANVLCAEKNGQLWVLSANRETDTTCVYAET